MNGDGKHRNDAEMGKNLSTSGGLKGKGSQQGFQKEKRGNTFLVRAWCIRRGRGKMLLAGRGESQESKRTKILQRERGAFRSKKGKGSPKWQKVPFTKKKEEKRQRIRRRSFHPEELRDRYREGKPEDRGFPNDIRCRAGTIEKRQWGSSPSNLSRTNP